MYGVNWVLYYAVYSKDIALIEVILRKHPVPISIVYESWNNRPYTFLLFSELAVNVCFRGKPPNERAIIYVTEQRCDKFVF